ncbi:hypothetical protein NYO98_09280 [Nocardioides sp. STR2]|uniref:TRAP-type C4-dicarboxylate transport system, substrate-binding protein n=2 Tax=Nocardioides pini TaxID=2975053 RepID=A0ABT4CBX9_9ACTN|nr:hypothetical protein [Nocardioides pini]
MSAGTLRAMGVCVTLVTLLVGCARPAEPRSAEPVHLTLVTYDGADTPGGALVKHFVEEVQRADPSITITPDFSGAPHEPDAVTAVSSGTADLAMVASRAFDTAGVTTLQALNTPLLIDTTSLANAVATSDLVPDLLAGLDEIELIGLGIAPEGMRHLFTEAKAVTDVNDLRGTVVRSPQSEAVWSFLTATRATPIFDDSMSYDVSESQYDLELKFDQTAGNLTLFPKYDVIVLNEESALELSTAQLESLWTAASETTTWAVATTDSDAARAEVFCANGGKIAAATPAELEEWQAVARPVVQDLRSVGTTADLIDAITDMKTGIDADDPITNCAGAGAAESTAGPRLNGTYEFSATPREIGRAGIHDEAFIDINAGDYRIVLENGTLTRTHHLTSGTRAGEQESDTASYTLNGDRVTFRWSPQAGDYTEAKVVVQDDGSLKFTDWVEGWTEPKFLLLDKVVLSYWERVE